MVAGVCLVGDFGVGVAVGAVVLAVASCATSLSFSRNNSTTYWLGIISGKVEINCRGPLEIVYL